MVHSAAAHTLNSVSVTLCTYSVVTRWCSSIVPYNPIHQDSTHSVTCFNADLLIDSSLHHVSILAVRLLNWICEKRERLSGIRWDKLSWSIGCLLIFCFTTTEKGLPWKCDPRSFRSFICPVQPCLENQGHDVMWQRSQTSCVLEYCWCLCEWSGKFLKIQYVCWREIFLFSFCLLSGRELY